MWIYYHFVGRRNLYLGATQNTVSSELNLRAILPNRYSGRVRDRKVYILWSNFMPHFRTDSIFGLLPSVIQIKQNNKHGVTLERKTHTLEVCVFNIVSKH